MKKQVNNELIDMTPEEITQLQKDQVTPMTDLEASLSELRKLRNKLLFDTDWWASSDLTITDEQKKYRQDLRDITNGLTTVKKINAVVFPTKPE